MKYILLIILIAFISGNAQVQNSPSKDIVNGTYTALFAEKGISGPTKEKVIQLAENNGTLMLAVAACEKCFPAIYTYNDDLTSKLKKTVFTNSVGLYVIDYNDIGFIVMMPDLTFNENFSYLNFYGKDKLEVSKMTKNKIEAYTLPLLDLL